MIWFAKEISSYIRVIGIGNKRYKNIRKFKNIHAGERCFIVATGPSLTYEDLDKIKNEITFGVNSICLSYDKTDFRPTYFGVVDYDVYQKLKDSTDLIRNNNVFVSKKIDKSENRKKIGMYYLLINIIIGMKLYIRIFIQLDLAIMQVDYYMIVIL